MELDPENDPASWLCCIASRLQIELLTWSHHHYPARCHNGLPLAACCLVWISKTPSCEMHLLHQPTAAFVMQVWTVIIAPQRGVTLA